MSAYADITINESRLRPAYGAPAIADCIRNPGYRPTYSYSLACAISINPPCKHGEFMAAAQDFHGKNSIIQFGKICKYPDTVLTDIRVNFLLLYFFDYTFFC